MWLIQMLCHFTTTRHVGVNIWSVSDDWKPNPVESKLYSLFLTMNDGTGYHSILLQ